MSLNLIESITNHFGSKSAALAAIGSHSSDLPTQARIVAQDEREGGVRALLNLGHTFAHAIERVTQYQVPHGEAVAMGLMAGADALAVSFLVSPLALLVALLPGAIAWMLARQRT